MPPRAAVHSLKARIGDRTITTEVKPKEEAREEFMAAVSQGHTAVLAQQEPSAQVFSLELGNLEAMTEAVVSLSYVRLLDAASGTLEWVHTATWTPPYTGAAGDQARGEAETRAQNPVFSAHVSYSLTYEVRLLSRRGFKAVECSRPGVSIQDAHAEGGVLAKLVTVNESGEGLS
jgi:hypothetical protein